MTTEKDIYVEQNYGNGKKQGSTKLGKIYNRSGKEYKWSRLSHVDKDSQTVILFSQKVHQKAKFTELNFSDGEKF